MKSMEKEGKSEQSSDPTLFVGLMKSMKPWNRPHPYHAGFNKHMHLQMVQ
jgi:hypothetical protein